MLLMCSLKQQRGAFPTSTLISLKTFIRNPRIATQEELVSITYITDDIGIECY